MYVHLVHIDETNTDNWTIFGIFSSEEKAYEALASKNLDLNCVAIHRYILDSDDSSHWN
jgi:hypothetical protein